MELYHSSPNDFDTFSLSQVKSTTDINKYGYGFYFGANEEDVIGHAHTQFIQGRPFYVYLVKILDSPNIVGYEDEINDYHFQKIVRQLHKMDKSDETEQLEEERQEYGMNNRQVYDWLTGVFSAKEASAIFDTAHIVGFKIDGTGWYNGTIYTIFNPENIKILDKQEYE